MKYQPPYDPALAGVRQPNGTFNVNADAPYVNGDPSTATEGSIPPDDAFEHPQREIVAAIVAAGLTPDHTVLTQLRQAIARSASGATYYASAGSANTYTLTAVPSAAGVSFDVPSSPFLGQFVRLIPHQTNTGAATATWAGVTKAIRNWYDRDLTGGELVATRPTEAWYDPDANGGDGALMLTPWSVAGHLLPIHPEIMAAGNVFSISSSVGQVVVATDQVILWRGSVLFSTASLNAGQRTFATAANKTYHLRLNLITRLLSLQDLGGATYNPSSLSETSAAFDSTYDDALIARVTTNGGNTPSVTPLINKARLMTVANRTIAAGSWTQLGNTATYTASDSVTINWARTPVFLPSWIIADSSEALAAALGSSADHDRRFEITMTRYAAVASLTFDMRESDVTYGLLMQAS